MTFTPIWHKSLILPNQWYVTIGWELFILFEPKKAFSP